MVQESIVQGSLCCPKAQTLCWLVSCATVAMSATSSQGSCAGLHAHLRAPPGHHPRAQRVQPAGAGCHIDVRHAALQRAPITWAAGNNAATFHTPPHSRQRGCTQHVALAPSWWSRTAASCTYHTSQLQTNSQTGDSRTREDVAGKERTGQDRTGQDRTAKSRAEPG